MANFCALESIVKKVEKQLMGYEIIFANHLSAEGLKSRIYKEPLQLNNKKNNTI